MVKGNEALNFQIKGDKTMKKTFAFLIAAITACSLPIGQTHAKPWAGEMILKRAKITFIMPDGDDKDTDTKVSVSVTTKFNSQFDLTLASRDDFAGNETWEDTGGKEYPYELNFAGLKLIQINSDVKTTITINPVRNDTVKFGYRLILIFDDDDPSTPPVELRQEKSGITLSQDNRSYTF